MWNGLRGRAIFFWRQVRPKVMVPLMAGWTAVSTGREIAGLLLSDESLHKFWISVLPAWPLRVWFTGCLLILLCSVVDAAYRAVDAAERRRDCADLEAEEIRRNYRLADDWVVAADLFRTLLEQRIQVVWTLAQGQSTASWSLYGDSEPHTRMLERACELAGQSLERSRLWAEQPATVKGAPSQRDRWLEFVRSRENARFTGSGHTKPDAEDVITWTSLSFDEIALKSKRLCEECSISERIQEIKTT